ncbi:MAG TPA: TetR/AcrR family transcriptional regulator [Solirubrobacteraceae bacterium]|nr:TetR/AcrR family transcriptional regulator [Solirubrobacteraceae bacterium]
MPKIRQETRVERRQSLLEAAWRCASERGFRDLTVDDVCAEAGVSKGAFYGYFAQKRDLLLALLDDDAASLDHELEMITGESDSSVDRLRRFAQVTLASGEEPGRVQVRSDLWSELLTDGEVRRRLTEANRRRRELVRGWVQEGVRSGELTEIPENALASILLALADGLILHSALDAGAFQWRNVRQAIDVLLAAIESG